MDNKKVTACVIVIGDEILSGRTQDKNLQWLASLLNEHGVQVAESRTIPDKHQTIIETVNHCRQKFDYVITTGGIGPTHDDITTECIARAFGVKLATNPEVEAMIRSRPAANETVMRARMKMAQIPEGAQLVRSEMGPPGYRIDNVFVLAGIPGIMRSMSSSMVKMLSGGMPVKSVSVDAYLTESTIAGPLQDIQDRYEDVSLGSYPFYKDEVYGTSLVIRSTHPEHLNQAHIEVLQMLDKLNSGKT